MIYIKKINDVEYQLGGTVATPQMLKDGWVQYEGPVPRGTNYRMVDGVLEAFTPELPVGAQIAIYKEYLTNTDFKMIPGYEPKEGEDLEDITAKRKVARDYIRENEISRDALVPNVN